MQVIINGSHLSTIKKGLKLLLDKEEAACRGKAEKQALSECGEGEKPGKYDWQYMPAARKWEKIQHVLSCLST